MVVSGKVAKQLDFLVIGGSVNGTGFTRNAAGRELSSAQVEQDDLGGAIGTLPWKGRKKPTAGDPVLGSSAQRAGTLIASVCTSGITSQARILVMNERASGGSHSEKTCRNLPRLMPLNDWFSEIRSVAKSQLPQMRT